MHQLPFHKRVEGAFARLNTQQKQAVSTINGAVIVDAGPGTGKTQILSLRIAEILNRTDANPDNILCLTFTEAGESQMRSRLNHLLGASISEKVNIHTFHGFCSKIIEENPAYFPEFYRQMNEFEEWKAFKELIDKLPPDSLLKPSSYDLYTKHRSLQSHFERIQKERDYFFPYSQAKTMAERLEEYRDGLPQNRHFLYQRKTKHNAAGDPKTEDIKRENKRIAYVLAILHAFGLYENILRTKRLRNYQHLLEWVNLEFAKKSTLLQQCQEKYQYLLVDEFQDTNVEQFLLVKALAIPWYSDESTEENLQSNIFVVGDVNQTIYRFQGASESNMVEFARIFCPQRITLTQNYRSTQAILDAAHRLIKRNPSTHPPTLLQANVSYEAINPQLHCYADQTQEAIATVHRIQQLCEQGISADTIAVLFRKNRRGLLVAKRLQQFGIPYQFANPTHLLHLPLIQAIGRVLQYIDTEQHTPFQGEGLLTEVLLAPFSGHSALAIAQLYAARAEHAPKTPLRTFVSQNKDLARQFIIIQRLETLISQVLYYPADQFVSLVLRTLQIPQWIFSRDLPESKKTALFGQLAAFHQFYTDAFDPRQFYSVTNLSSFLSEVFTSYVKEQFPLPYNQETGSKKGVQLLSVHAAKGQEFDYVFLIGCEKQTWTTKPPHFRLLPLHFLQYENEKNDASHADRTEDEHTLIDERRLFYVAMTRAKKQLYLTGTPNDKKGDSRNFLRETLADPDSHPLDITALCNEEYNQALAQMLTATDPAISDAFAMDAQKSQLIFPQPIGEFCKRFVLSYSSYRAYKTCPWGFYCERILQIPYGQTKIESNLGILVHDCIAHFFRMAVQNNHVPSPCHYEHIFAEQTKTFYMHNQAAREKNIHEAKQKFLQIVGFLEEVFSQAQAYARQQYLPISQCIWSEKTIEAVLSYGGDQYPIRGRMDTLYQTAHGLCVIDYKTGKVNFDSFALQPTLTEPDVANQEDPFCSHIGQALFYVILLQNQTAMPSQVLSVDFAYWQEGKIQKGHVLVRPHPTGDEDFLLIEQDDLATFRQSIIDVWQGIHRHEFTTGCNKSDCPYCAMFKNMPPQDSLTTY